MQRGSYNRQLLLDSFMSLLFDTMGINFEKYQKYECGRGKQDAELPYIQPLFIIKLV